MLWPQRAHARCTPRQALKLAEQGERLLGGKAATRARAHYKRAVARCPEDSRLLCGQATAEAGEGPWAKGLEALRGCLGRGGLPAAVLAAARKAHEATLLRGAGELGAGKVTEVGALPGAHAAAPRWAPDRKRMSFEARPLKQARQVFVVDLATKERSQPIPDFFDTGTEAERRQAARRIGLIPRFSLAWHPGGIGFIYLSGLPNEHPINVFMHEEGCLTCAAGFSKARKFHPAWTSDGGSFAYTTLEGDQARIRAVTLLKLAEGPRTLVDGSAVGGVPYRPVFAPEGPAPVFQVHRTDAGETDLFVLDDPQGKDKTPRRLTSLAGSEFDASWSPDGRWLAFYANRGLYPGQLSDDTAERGGVGDIDLFVVPADGSAPPTLLAADVVWGHAAGPAWTSHGGQRVWFVKRDEALADPIMWMTVDSAAAGRVRVATEHNADLAVSANGDTVHLAWAAFSGRTGPGSRWRRIFRATVELPAAALEGEDSPETPPVGADVRPL